MSPKPGEERHVNHPDHDNGEAPEDIETDDDATVDVAGMGNGDDEGGGDADPAQG